MLNENKNSVTSPLSDEQFAHLPAETTFKMTCENAGKFYGLIN